MITPWWRETFVRQESWADEVWTFDWCKGFNGVEPVSAIQSFLNQAHGELKLEKIGYDAQMHHYSPNKLPSEFFTYDEIKASLPGIFASAVNATENINQLKSIKTKREIAKLRLANKVAEVGVKALLCSCPRRGSRNRLGSRSQLCCSENGRSARYSLYLL